MPVDPKVKALLGDKPSAWHDVATMTVEKARALDHDPEVAAAVAARHAIEPPEEREVPVEGGSIRIRLQRPQGEPAGLLAWFPGGGFMLGTLDADEEMARAMAQATGCLVAAVAYRLAPEHVFPTAHEDAYAALAWLAEHGRELGAGDVPLVVAGDSAGGNLAASVAQMARDRGGPPLTFQLLIYPMIVRHFDAVSRTDPEVGVLAPWEGVEWIWDAYLAGADGRDPIASPLCAASLDGLPPALVVTAEYDVLRDEGVAYAEALARHGVPVEHRQYADMPHGFARWISKVDAADECLEHMRAAVREALAAAPNDEEPAWGRRT
jgi:acetyl esterase/lipase